MTGVEHANAIIDQRRHQPPPQGGPQRHRHHQGDDAIRLAGDGLTSIEILEKREYGGWDSDADPLMRINEQGDWTGISQAQADGLVWTKREEILDHAAYDDSLSPASSIVSMSWRGTGRSRNGSQKRGVTTT